MVSENKVLVVMPEIAE